jgi:hypothetical protein
VSGQSTGLPSAASVTYATGAMRLSMIQSLRHGLEAATYRGTGSVIVMTQ